MIEELRDKIAGHIRNCCYIAWDMGHANDFDVSRAIEITNETTEAIIKDIEGDTK